MSSTTAQIAADTDILIAGSGPSALWLARACSARGLRVLVVSDGLDKPFEATYGLFADQLPSLLSAAAAALWPATEARTSRGVRTIDRPYVRLDSECLYRLMAQTDAQGFATRAGQVVGVDLGDANFSVRLESGELITARRVVDCTGHRRALHADPGAALAQVAIGGTLIGSHGLTAPLLMDFTGPAHGTFLYALPLSPTELFVEETALICRNAPSWSVLESRLRDRLDGMGLTGELTVQERCVIPMDPALPDLNSAVLAFGAAAGLVHPATGYQLAACLALAEPVAERLAATMELAPQAAATRVWDALWPSHRRRVRALRMFGARFVATLDHADQAAFFDAFFRLPPRMVRTYLDHDSGVGETCAAMLRVFLALPVALRWRLARVGAARPMPILRPLLAL